VSPRVSSGAIFHKNDRARERPNWKYVLSAAVSIASGSRERERKTSKKDDAPAPSASPKTVDSAKPVKASKSA